MIVTGDEADVSSRKQSSADTHSEQQVYMGHICKRARKIIQ